MRSRFVLVVDSTMPLPVTAVADDLTVSSPWTQDECDEFIASNADMDASRLTTKLDDLIDTVIDRYERQHWTWPHDDDAGKMLDAERRAAIYELEFEIEAC